jgi:hypothetical protein
MLPIKRTVTYPDGMLDHFERTIDNNCVKTADIRTNSSRARAIQRELFRVIDVDLKTQSLSDSIMKEAFKAYNDELIEHSVTIPTVQPNRRGEELINRAMKVIENLAS